MKGPAKPSPTSKASVTALNPKVDRKGESEIEDLDLEAIVERMAGVGMTAGMIGYAIGVQTKVIESRFGEALARGPAKANFAVAHALYQTATDRAHKSHAACAIYWTKARMGWRDGDREEDERPAAPAEALTDDVVEQNFSSLMSDLREAAKK